MRDQLLCMLGQTIPSLTETVHYLVSEVEPGSHVTLTSSSRQQASRLNWEDVESVNRELSVSGPMTKDVKQILGNPQFRHCSPMCALILALRHPERVHRQGELAD